MLLEPDGESYSFSRYFCRIILPREVRTPPPKLTKSNSSILLSQSSVNATKSLEVQLETARKVLQLTEDVGTMTELVKEALKVSNQVSEILRLVRDYTTTEETVKSLSRSLNEVAARSLGMVPMSPKRRAFF